MQPGAADHAAGRPLRQGALTVSVFPPDLLEGGHLRLCSFGGEPISADVAGHLGVGVDGGQLLDP